MQTMNTVSHIKELSLNEIEEVSGGIIPLVAAALGTLTGGGLTAVGIYLWNH